MRFADRTEAGTALGRVLATRLERVPDIVVLAIPRGGVVVGAEVARALDAPIDVVVPRKVRAPWNPELGLGAIAPGVRVLDEDLIRRLHVTPDYLEREIAAEEREILRREHVYRDGRDAVPLKGRVVVVVDDGVATGGTAVASLRWAFVQEPARVILAVPVAPPQTVQRLAEEADDVVVLDTPEPFLAVGQWYADFEQTTDDEVIQLLSGLARSPA